MMVVIVLSNCPQKLRGDLTRWLFEIDTNVFVGNMNARVRDAVWDRICTNIKTGRASMAYSSNNEQKLEFRIHNTDWEPIDFDGIKLVYRRMETNDDFNYKAASKAAVYHKNRLKQRYASGEYNDFMIADIVIISGRIIKMAALHIKNGNESENCCFLVKCEETLRQDIAELTGVTDELLVSKGMTIKDALTKFGEFCGGKRIVGHNINSVVRYVQKECEINGIPIFRNQLTDTMRLARKKLDDLDGYSLDAVAGYFEIRVDDSDKMLYNCRRILRVFEKLNEI